MIGHNGGPKIEPFGIKAAWLHWVNQAELRRLSVLQVRIERRKRAIKVMTDERQTIMMRAIRRMRRATGKE